MFIATWQTFQGCGSSHPRHSSYLTSVWAMGVESPQHCSSCLMVPDCPRTFVSDTLSRMRGSMGLTVVCEKRPALASADKEDLEHSGRGRKWQLSVSSVCPEMAEYHQPRVFHLPLDTVIPARGCKGKVKRIPKHTLSFSSPCCFRWSGWSPQRSLRTESSHLRVFFLAQLVPSCRLIAPMPFPLGLHSSCHLILITRQLLVS